MEQTNNDRQKTYNLKDAIDMNYGNTETHVPKYVAEKNQNEALIRGLIIGFIIGVAFGFAYVLCK